MSLRIACAVGAFWNDTRGFILPYVTVMLAVFIGFAVLALDGARVLATQTSFRMRPTRLRLWAQPSSIGCRIRPRGRPMPSTIS